MQTETHNNHLTQQTKPSTNPDTQKYQAVRYVYRNEKRKFTVFGHTIEPLAKLQRNFAAVSLASRFWTRAATNRA
jgi:hypothetical protein